MEDEQIIELYWQRSADAISETAKKYGAYCLGIAGHILRDAGDAEECVNDAWLRAWNTIPPQRPRVLRLFLAKITRNLAFDRFRAQNAEKRGGGQFDLVLDELAQCVPAPCGPEGELAAKELSAAVSRWLWRLPAEKRLAFVLRYWYVLPVKEIAAKFNWSETKTVNLLSRLRADLRAALEKEDFL